jgi:hypothetical protein
VLKEMVAIAKVTTRMMLCLESIHNNNIQEQTQAQATKEAQQKKAPAPEKKNDKFVIYYIITINFVKRHKTLLLLIQLNVDA